MIYLFLFLVVILMIISYYFSNKDFMHPATILCAFYVFSIIFAFHYYDYWRLYEYGGRAVYLTVLGIFSFIIGCFCFEKFRIGSKRSLIQKEKKIMYGRVDVNNVVVLIVLFVSILSFFVFIIYFRNNIGAAAINEMIASYKMYKRTEEGELPLAINLLIKMVALFSHNCIYVYINNIVVKSHKRKDDLLLIPPVIYFLISLFNANRGNMIMFVIASFCAWNIIYHRVYGWKRLITGKIIKKGAIITVCVLIGFWLLVFLTRSKTAYASFNFMGYITVYISGAIASFDVYLKQGGSDCLWFGQETFVALNNNLNSLFGIGHESQRVLEYIRTGQYSVTNIYSAFRRFYHDFGVGGVIVLPFIQGGVTSKVYARIKRSFRKNIDFSMCFYSYFFHTVIFIGTDEFFYSSDISFGGVAKVIMMAVIYYLFFYRAQWSEKMLRLSFYENKKKSIF